MTKFNTLCTRCLAPIECEWPDAIEWAGKPTPTLEYVANAMRSKNVMICCDKCLDEMPDVKLEDLKHD